MTHLKSHHITIFLLTITLVFGYCFRLAPEVFADNYTIIIDSSARSHEVPCASPGVANNDCSIEDIFVGSSAAIPFSMASSGHDNRNFKVSVADSVSAIDIYNPIPIQFTNPCNNCSIEINGAKSDGSKTKIVPAGTTPPTVAFVVSEDIGNITIKNFDFQGFANIAINVQSIHNTHVEISTNNFGQSNSSSQPNDVAIQLTDADQLLISHNFFGGETDKGIAILGSSSETTIQGNLFGVSNATDFTTIPGIAHDAIYIADTSQNTHISENIVSNAGRNGVTIVGGNGHEIGANNRFFNNAGAGVILASRGNDQTPAANLLNAYRLNGQIKISGTAESGSQIQIYQANHASNPLVTPDSTGGEGFRMLQSSVVDGPDDENTTTGSFLFTVSASDLVIGDTLSAIKTLNHNSSGFSNNVTIVEKQAPTVTAAGTPTNPVSGSTVTLASTANDPDTASNLLAYNWTQTSGPNVTLADTHAGTTTFTVPTITTATTFSFTVTVTDETNLTGTAVATVSASPSPSSNHAPVANAGIDQTIVSNSNVQLDGTASTDQDNDPLTYHWSQATSDSYHIILSDTTNSRPQFTAPSINELQTDLHFTLQVTDSHNAQSSDDVIIHVTRTRVAPLAVLSVRNGSTFPAGTVITLDGGSSTFDHASSTHHYHFRQIPNNSSDTPLTISQTADTTSTATVTIPSTLTTARDYTFALVVNDGTVDSSEVTAIVHATIPQPTTSPTTTTSPTPTATCSSESPIARAGDNISVDNTPGQVITLNGGLSSDPHNLPLTYYWRQLAGGPRVDIRNDQSPTPNFTIPNFSETSISVSFQLTVTNSCSKVATSIVKVTMGSNDPDHDGIDTPTEERLGTDPNNPDSDGDGVADGIEVHSSCMSPLNPDTDNDGITDGGEDMNHNGITDGGETNPCLADTDHDGMPDGFETTYHLNPLDPRDANEDADNDGLTNIEEFIYKTNPRDPDSDHDGLPDGIEIKTSRTAANKDDTDSDGILDGNEDINHNGIVDPGETDPNHFDTDGDSLSDGLETGLTKPQGKDTDLKKFQPDLDPLSKTNPLTADTDGDHIFDGNEDTNHNGSVDCGETNPLDPTNKVVLCQIIPRSTTKSTPSTKQTRISQSSGFSISVTSTSTKQTKPLPSGGIVNLVSSSQTSNQQFSIVVSKGSGKQTRITIPTFNPMASITVLSNMILPTTGPMISSILVYDSLSSPRNK